MVLSCKALQDHAQEVLAHSMMLNFLIVFDIVAWPLMFMYSLLPFMPSLLYSSSSSSSSSAADLHIPQRKHSSLVSIIRTDLLGVGGEEGGGGEGERREGGEEEERSFRFC